MRLATYALVIAAVLAGWPAGGRSGLADVLPPRYVSLGDSLAASDQPDAQGAWVTTRLEFYRVPIYMAQFPFAHTLTMTYRLSAGELEVRTRIDNLSTEPMPVTIGFHPYFQLTDSNRSDWTLSVPARTHWLLDNRPESRTPSEPPRPASPEPPGA